VEGVRWDEQGRVARKGRGRSVEGAGGGKEGEEKLR